jgi:GT2 family glycosyltransferase
VSFSAADLSVIVPTRERWETLDETLGALEAQTARGFETIVVVDGNDEDVPELAGVRVLAQQRAGPGAARNRAVAHSTRPLVLFLGDDMVPRPDFVARHLELHRRHPSSEVAVLGRIVWHRAVPRDRLHRWLEWSCALFDYRLLEESGDQDAGWARFYSSNVSLKRELFLSVGGFDESFAFDYEDLDLAWRLGGRAMRLVYEPGAVVEHRHVYDWAAVRGRYRSRAAAERLMAAKHDWFEPWFKKQIEAATAEPSASRLWALTVDWVPHKPTRMRAAVERRANRHYLQRLAPAFLEAWQEGLEATKPPSVAKTSPQAPHGGTTGLGEGTVR